MSDQQIACSECGGTFVFTAAEQAFYAEKQLAAPPKRCKACRQARKSAREGGGGGGGNRRFSGGVNEYRAPMSGGSDTFRGPPRGRPAPGGGGRDGRPGGNFRGPGGPGAGGPSPRFPQNGRGGPPPHRGASGGDYRSPSFPGEARSFPAPRPRFDAPAPAPEPRPAKGPQQRVRPERPKFDITCAECGMQAQVPFKPLEGRQVFCQPCYRARRGSMENATEGVAVGETDSGIVE